MPRKDRVRNLRPEMKLGANTIAYLLNISPKLVRSLRERGVLGGTVADLRWFIDEWMIWRGVDKGQPWHRVAQSLSMEDFPAGDPWPEERTKSREESGSDTGPVSEHSGAERSDTDPLS